jgi:glycosyltransferase involved in cell wall biosynthesis
MINVANIAETPTDWHWIAHAYPAEGPRVDWRTFSATKRPGLESRVPGLHWGRIRAALQARNSAADGWLDQLVSHGPYTTFYAATMLGTQRREIPHLAMSFNFTDLPPTRRFAMMKRAFGSIDRFVVFSRMERELYSELFEIPMSKLDFVHWGVAPPIAGPLPRAIEQRYFVAMGGEARDYATLLDAARMMPRVRFVAIVRPWSLESLSVPDNVSVLVNAPWNEAWSYVWHSEAAILPLRSSRTPNGHVTIVGGMHIGKAHIVTRSIGISDYAFDGTTALMINEQSPKALIEAIQRILDEPGLAERLGGAAKEFAQKYCTEEVTATYFRDYLIRTLGAGLVSA